MTELRVLLALLSFIVFSLVLSERGISSALSPLCVICGASLFFSLFGCLGILPVAGWLYYLLAMAAAGYLMYRFFIQKQALPVLSFGFFFFAGACLFISLLLWAREPMFSTWDEFSFWGTASKLTKLYGEFYTTAPVGWAWPATYPPALISLAYCVQFLGEGFVEWQVYASNDFLLLAALAAMLAPFEKKHHWNIVLPLAVVGFLTPFIFTHYSQPIKISSVYLDSLADVPMGFLFAASLIAYYAGERKNLRDLIPSCLALAMLTLTKDTGFALALVAAVLIFIDQLATKKILASLGKFSLCLGCVLGPFLGWSIYLGVSSGVNRFELGGVTNVGMLEMPLLALREVFSSNPDPRFVEIMQGMINLFFTSRITLIGPGVLAVFGILAMVAIAAFITKNKTHRRSCILFGLFSIFGFLAYYLLISLTYIYIFRPEQAYESYERYIYPFYIGWFLVAAVLLAISARDSRFVVEGRAVLSALCLLFCFRFWQFIPMQYCVLGFNSAEYNYRRAFNEDVRELTAQLDPNGKTFIVSSDDDGFKWVQYCYAFLPWQVDYSYGGGPLVTRERQPNGDTLILEVSLEDWEHHLIETGCTTVFIDNADEAFVKKYGSLFSDRLESGVPLYKVAQQNGRVRLEPMGGGVT